jgi:hypothetical protein
MKKAHAVWQVILGPVRYGGKGFQPVWFFKDDDKLEAYPTRPWHSQLPDLSAELRPIRDRANYGDRAYGGSISVDVDSVK